MTDAAPTPDTVRRRLYLVRWVALADALLLVALVSASLLDRRDLVSVLGPVHGGNFLLLVVLTYTGAADGFGAGGFWRRRCFPAGRSARLSASG